MVASKINYGQPKPRYRHFYRFFGYIVYVIIMHKLYISFESIFDADFEFNVDKGHLGSCEVNHNTELRNKGRATVILRV